MRFAAARIEDSGQSGNGNGNGSGSGSGPGYRIVPREAFFAFYDQIAGLDVDELVERYRLPIADAETLVPALMTYRELLAETSAPNILVPEASLRAGLLLDLAGAAAGHGLEQMRTQVLAGASALGEKYRYDAAHGSKVAALAVRLFDELRSEHGLQDRDRLLLEVASLLHDVGLFVGLRAHHRHSLYILMQSEIFGLSHDDMAVVANVARYHRRGMPQKGHPEFLALDRDRRVDVLKMAAILRLANALDADHLQKVNDLRLVRDAEPWVLEADGGGDLTMERLAALSRSDLFTDVFGRRLVFRESGATA
jgi:exopolyphosphatase/guanosine-5'-triphosphate,3'-diphosphate pyrophosphatase